MDSCAHLEHARNFEPRRRSSRHEAILLAFCASGCPTGCSGFPGVLLLAAVGVLDTFRILLFQPIFDQVLQARRA